MGNHNRTLWFVGTLTVVGLLAGSATYTLNDRTRPRIIWNEPAVAATRSAPPESPAPARRLTGPAAAARCGTPAAKPVPDGKPIVLPVPGGTSFTVGDISADAWRTPPAMDASFRLNFQGLMWMMPLAARAAADHQRKSLRVLVEQAVAFHEQNPDNGGNDFGWDEGTALRRLETENCLYALTRAAALVPGMAEDAAVLLGPRYYGPPGLPVHNHGLMANLQLVRAGTLLGRSDWRDDETGWVVGRWSWTDPDTTFYTVRYGPPQRAHGHHDRAAGLTWTTRGVRVLVGPGLGSYDARAAFRQYQMSPQAQNVAVPAGGKPGDGIATVASSGTDAGRHTYVVYDEVYRTPHSRWIVVDDRKGRVTVTDSFPRASSWRQMWHLDPQWRLLRSSATVLEFGHPSGRHLTVTTTGRVTSVGRGVTEPLQGWHAPAIGNPVAAPEITVRDHGGECTTTFTVT